MAQRRSEIYHHCLTDSFYNQQSPRPTHQWPTAAGHIGHAGNLSDHAGRLVPAVNRMGVISHIGDPARLDPGQGRGYASQLYERPWLRAAAAGRGVASRCSRRAPPTRRGRKDTLGLAPSPANAPSAAAFPRLVSEAERIELWVALSSS